MAAKTQSEIVFLRRSEVERRLGYSRALIYAKLKFNPNRPNDYDPDFPRPVKIGKRAVGWVEQEIVDYQRAKIEKSRSEPAAA